MICNRRCLIVCLSVCLLAALGKNVRTDLRDILREVGNGPVAHSPSATGERISEYLLCTDIDDRRWWHWPVATGIASGLWTIRLGSELEARPLSLSVRQLVSSRSLLSGD